MTTEEHARYVKWRAAGASASVAHHFALRNPDATIPESTTDRIVHDRVCRQLRKRFAAMPPPPPVVRWVDESYDFSPAAHDFVRRSITEFRAKLADHFIIGSAE